MNWFAVILFALLIVATIFEMLYKYHEHKEFMALMKKEHDERVERFWRKKNEDLARK